MSRIATLNVRFSPFPLTENACSENTTKKRIFDILKYRTAKLSFRSWSVCRIVLLCQGWETVLSTVSYHLLSSTVFSCIQNGTTSFIFLWCENIPFFQRWKLGLNAASLRRHKNVMSTCSIESLARQCSFVLKVLSYH
jgi:hypothetical protein